MPVIMRAYLRLIAFTLALLLGAYSVTFAQMRIDGVPAIITGAKTFTGVVKFPDGSAAAPSITFTNDPDTGFFSGVAANIISVTIGTVEQFRFRPTSLVLASDVNLQWATASPLAGATAESVVVGRDGNNILALRNTTNAQEFRVWNTYTSVTEGEFGKLEWASNVFRVGTEKGSGSGTARQLALVTDDTNRWEIGATSGHLLASTDNTFNIGATNATRPASVFLAAPAIVIGSGTGLTLDNSGEVRQLVYKFTVASTAFVCAAVTCDVTIGTLPAKTFVSHALADLTTTFACTATCTTATLSATLGKTAGGNEYLLSFDADAATAQFGDLAAELGASINPTSVPTVNGDVASWSGTTAVVMRLTSAVGNIGDGAVSNLSQGTATFYLTTTKMP